ncbi:ead/Ea22-like family protein [Escherichia coli]|uniref:ead/Ea22-like family protein n=1 Tax=Escherichia coli TaxID=562 RepID=UPI000D6DFA2A|nr:ead/Ea22-like family protein [Escherichia coli]HAO1323937.1 ead/Ea22-like family protein [Escherichia coli]
MSNIDKRALREAANAANAASWGNWEPYKPHKGARGYEVKVGVKAVAQHCLKVDSVFIAAANPVTVLALLDELEAKDSTISTQQQEIRTLLNALEQATEKRNSDIPGQKRLIGWRASDYTDETSDPELAKNWAAAIGVLPIFEGDVNTKLSAAGIGKGE